jgi:hypothetical protein
MYSLLLTILLLFSCTDRQKETATKKQENLPIAYHDHYDTAVRTIHVFVALCDNKYQGIVPVPPAIGNGQDPDNNLYWGCGYGVRSYFKKSKSWKLIKQYKVDSIIMERLLFKNTKANYYLIADAYNGKYIRQCTAAFLKSCSGQIKDTLRVNGITVGTNGNSKLLAYIGHDGFMDFNLAGSFESADNKTRDAIILACISKKYFQPYLTQTRANPIAWSTGLMSPEAYTLHDALEAYINNEPAANIRNSAAAAYSKYQHCSQKAARNLIVSGW